MKGIAHFLSGIAVATFIPDAAQQAADGSLVLALGGLFGLLPDTLDFRLARYFERFDDEIDPDPNAMRPQSIAERVASAMRSAFETGQSRTVMLHTVRLGADLWREYTLSFRPTTDEVVVRVGPIVSTAGVPLPGSTPVEPAEGRARVGVPMVLTYDEEIKINAFSGPSFRFERRRPATGAADRPSGQSGRGAGPIGGEDAIHVTFLPWHRRRTHSLVLAAAVGLGAGLLLGRTAGLVSGLAYATHIVEDQLGHMGSNLAWPFTRKRTAGLGWLHSGDGTPNFLTVWIAIALIIFNLDRFAALPRLPALPYLLTTVLLPLLALGGLYGRARRRAPATGPAVEALRQGEMLSETEEVEL